jgi:hypothetical protein
MTTPTPSPRGSNQIARQLLALTDLALDAPILDLGAGSSTFLDSLLGEGYTNLIAADTSAAALQAHRQQLSAEQVTHVLWLVDDVTHAQELRTLSPILLWHDRAMLPLLRLPEQQAAYHEVLDYMVLPGQGWVLLSVPLPGEATQAGDLPLQPYQLADLVAFLGSDYTLHAHQAHRPRHPNGTLVASLYGLFRRNAQTAGPFRSLQ